MRYIALTLILGIALSLQAQNTPNFKKLDIVDTIHEKSYLLKYVEITAHKKVTIGNRIVIPEKGMVSFLDKINRKQKRKDNGLLLIDNQKTFKKIVSERSIVFFPLFDFYHELGIFELSDSMVCCPSDYDGYRYDFYHLSNSNELNDSSTMKEKFSQYEEGIYVKIEKVDVLAYVIDIKSIDSCLTCSMGTQNDYKFLSHEAKQDYNTSTMFEEYSFPIIVPLKIYSYNKQKRQKYSSANNRIDSCLH